MKKVFFIVLVTTLFLNPLWAINKEDISSVMKNKIDSATSVLKLKELDVKTKATKIFPIFDDVFDYALIAKLSLGKKHWLGMNDQQKELYIKKFETCLKNSYVDKLSLYTDEEVVILGIEESKKNRLQLLTELVSSKDKYEIIYKFYKSKNSGWLIYDVDIVGVSLIQTYRAQFDDMLKENSYDMLLSKLEIKPE